MKPFKGQTAKSQLNWKNQMDSILWEEDKRKSYQDSILNQINGRKILIFTILDITKQKK